MVNIFIPNKILEFPLKIFMRHIDIGLKMFWNDNILANVKKEICLFIILFFSNIFLPAQEQYNEIDLNKYQNIIFAMIENLNTIVEDNQSSEIVYDTFTIASNAVRNNEVSFKIDPGLDSILSGMNFSYYESGEISLVFGLKYLDTFVPNSSIHYSILIHEYRHLHDYLKNKDSFIDAKNNIKESYWYELDALRIEVEFIKYYLKEKYELSKFEEYLLTSFENNNLNSASVVLKRESMNTFFYLDRLENQYYNDKSMKDTIINELIVNGNVYLQNYNIEETDFVNYWNYIQLSTFNKFMIRLIAILMDNPTMTWEEVFEQYPGIGNIHYQIVEIQKSDSEKHNEYINSIYTLWEEDILQRLGKD